MDAGELTEADLAETEALLSAASPGPWFSSVEGRDHWSGNSIILTGGGDIELLTYMPHVTGPDHEQSIADQDFIAHARQAVPRLIAEVRRLRAELDGREAR
jgi:hypothetical protein